MVARFFFKVEYPGKQIARSVAAHTGAALYTLDPVTANVTAYGDYLNAMRANGETLAAAFSAL